MSTNAERDRFIVEKLAAGIPLGEVQKLLEEELGIKMRYFDLRLLADDLPINWKAHEKINNPAPAPNLKSEDEDEILEGDLIDDGHGGGSAGGKVKVSLSKIVRPGAVASGTVDFPSGARWQWMLDQLGRLIPEPEKGGQEPTPEELREFQEELVRLLRG